VAPGLSIVLMVLALEAPAGPVQVGAEPATLRCTNPFSGATWDVAIDPARRTADSFPADITDRTIKWHDAARGGNFEFDLASGELTVVYASSMGGTFLKDNCRFVRGNDSARADEPG
jgi:hypothetical protein